MATQMTHDTLVLHHFLVSKAGLDRWFSPNYMHSKLLHAFLYLNETVSHRFVVINDGVLYVRINWPIRIIITKEGLVYYLGHRGLMYLEEAPVICQCSVGGPQSPCAYGLSLNPLGSPQPSAGSLTAQDTQRNVSSPSWIKEEVQSSFITSYRENMQAPFRLKIPWPTLCTHIDVCEHVWTHTTSAF